MLHADAQQDDEGVLPAGARTRVDGWWTLAFAGAWFGVWMAQLGPLRVALPLQTASATEAT